VENGWMTHFPSTDAISSLLGVLGHAHAHKAAEDAVKNVCESEPGPRGWQAGKEELLCKEKDGQLM